MPLRSPDDPELIRLSGLARSGDIEARNAIALANRWLVVPIVNERMATLRGRPAAGRDDLDQEGFVGLLRAAELYDPSHGVTFATYAAYWIRQAVDRAVANAAAVALPQWARRKAAAWRRLASEGMPEGEIVARLGLKRRAEEFVRIVLARPMAAAVPIGNAGTGPEAPGCDPAERLMRSAAEDELHEALSQLEPDLRAMVVARYGIGTGEPVGNAEIGRRLGMHRETVLNRVRRGRERLAECLGRAAGEADRDWSPRGAVDVHP